MLPEQDVLMEQLYRDNIKKLTLHAAAILRDPTRVQDIVQDTFHTALLHIDIIMTHENPGGWLMETLKRKIKESLRAHYRDTSLFLSLDSDIPIDLVPSGDLIAEISEPNEIFPMGKIEQLLTPEEFRFLKRLVLDRASHLVVAKEFGISVYASQKRLERIREKLYKAFPERKGNKKKKK